jgi:hypothetical protein
MHKAAIETLFEQRSFAMNPSANTRSMPSAVWSCRPLFFLTQTFCLLESVSIKAVAAICTPKQDPCGGIVGKRACLSGKGVVVDQKPPQQRMAQDGQCSRENPYEEEATPRSAQWAHPRLTRRVC